MTKVLINLKFLHSSHKLCNAHWVEKFRFSLVFHFYREQIWATKYFYFYHRLVWKLKYFPPESLLSKFKHEWKMWINYLLEKIQLNQNRTLFMKFSVFHLRKILITWSSTGKTSWGWCSRFTSRNRGCNSGGHGGWRPRWHRVSWLIRIGRIC